MNNAFMNRLAKAPYLVAINAWCWSGLIVISLAALLAAPLWLACGRLSGWSWARGAREGTWLYGRLYLAVIRPFVKTEVINADLARQHSPAILVVNHQSWLDLYLMAAQGARDVCILVRAWPFKRLFFFGPLMRVAGYVETEGAKAADILSQCRREMDAGALVLCFPEGTRSPDGSLGKFHSGVFKLAAELGRPVVPMIVKHSGRIMPKGSFIFRPGRIEIELATPAQPGLFAGEPIPHGALRRFIRRRFLNALSHD